MTYPAGHGKQSAGDFAPSLGLYIPLGHGALSIAPRPQ